MNNKIVVLGVVFILLFTINLTLNNSHATSISIYQIPVTIYNYQNISTPSPFQEMVQLSESMIKGSYGINLVFNGNTANFEFVYRNGQVVPAWIEGNNSGTLLIFLKIVGILAHSSITIYLDIFPVTMNLLSDSGSYGIGENPELSKTYGLYDDGSSVFDFYDNFKGSSLNGNNWVYGGTGSIKVDNYVNITSTEYAYIISNEGFNPENTICDLMVVQADYSGIYLEGNGQVYNGWAVASMTGGSRNNSVGYFAIVNNPYIYYYYGSYANVINDFDASQSRPYFGLGLVFSESWQSVNKEMYANSYTLYSNQTVNYVPFPSSVYYGIGIYSLGGSSYINVSWIDVRAYPPYDIMPSVSFGIVASVTYNQVSNTNNQNLNNSNSYNITSGDFEFNNQYFSFIIDPLFIFSLLIVLSLIFVIFMAIAVVKKR